MPLVTSRSRFSTCLSLCAGTALLLGACLDHPVKAVEYDKSEEIEDTVAIAINKDVDILFVIDNSGSMAPKQTRVSANFEAFINVLEAKDVDANYRIGITTTDAGNPRCPNATYTPEGGNLVLSSCLDRIAQKEFQFADNDFATSCTDFCTKKDADITIRPTTTATDDNPAPRKWIERIEGQSNISGVANNVEAFQCYGPQGVAGCGFESHLESMYLALAKATSDSSKTNYGFLRDAAILAIVIITDEGDCSNNPKTGEIFTSNKIFWNSPDDPAPTSAVCFRAGVECTGGPGTYSECHSQNFDVNGAVTTDPDAMALPPVQKYIDFVKTIEAQKQRIDMSQKVLISLIAGVPLGYEKFEQEIPYQDSNDDHQVNFGIGPGCIFDAADATSVPPVREREFAEAFLEDPTKERNLYSLCEQDYSGALASIADQIRDQIKPACMPGCVRDLNPETPVVDAGCQLFEENIAEMTKTAIPRCSEVNGAWTAPAGATVCFATLVDKDGKQTPSAIDDMSPECVDEGFNLEFILVRSAAAPAGTTISAACQLSENKMRDCMLL